MGMVTTLPYRFERCISSEKSSCKKLDFPDGTDDVRLVTNNNQKIIQL